jgi:hypothetical protein
MGVDEIQPIQKALPGGEDMEMFISTAFIHTYNVASPSYKLVYNLVQL